MDLKMSSASFGDFLLWILCVFPSQGLHEQNEGGGCPWWYEGKRQNCVWQHPSDLRLAQRVCRGMHTHRRVETVEFSLSRIGASVTSVSVSLSFFLRELEKCLEDPDRLGPLFLKQVGLQGISSSCLLCNCFHTSDQSVIVCVLYLSRNGD